MAAKFSMANPAGLFDSGAHLEASDRLQGAAQELKQRHARQDAQDAADKQQQDAHAREQERRLARSMEAKAAALKAGGDPSYVRPVCLEDEAQQEEDSDDELLDELDPELERCVYYSGAYTKGREGD